MSSVIVVRVGYLTLEKEVVLVYLLTRCFISAYFAPLVVVIQTRFAGGSLISAK